MAIIWWLAKYQNSFWREIMLYVGLFLIPFSANQPHNLPFLILDQSKTNLKSHRTSHHIALCLLFFHHGIIITVIITMSYYPRQSTMMSGNHHSHSNQSCNQKCTQKCIRGSHHGGCS
jgi:hypothetical protein